MSSGIRQLDRVQSLLHPKVNCQTTADMLQLDRIYYLEPFYWGMKQASLPACRLSLVRETGRTTEQRLPISDTTIQHDS